jgi:hypothetical protein
MVYSEAKLKSNGDRASPCFKPFLIGNMWHKFLPTRTLLCVSFRNIFISLPSFGGGGGTQWAYYTRPPS